jgi:hypothetical protein
LAADFVAEKFLPMAQKKGWRMTPLLSLLLLSVVVASIVSYLSMVTARAVLVLDPRPAGKLFWYASACASAIAVSSGIIFERTNLLEFLVLVLMSAVSSGAALLATLRQMRHEVEVARLLAPRVKEYGIANFERLDLDRDGLFGWVELHRRLASAELTDWERALLQYMCDRWSELGHVTRYEQALYSGGLSDGGPITLVNLPVYEVSRADLEAYPARVHEQYRLW